MNKKTIIAFLLLALVLVLALAFVKNFDYSVFKKANDEAVPNEAPKSKDAADTLQTVYVWLTNDESVFQNLSAGDYCIIISTNNEEITCEITSPNSDSAVIKSLDPSYLSELDLLLENKNIYDYNGSSDQSGNPGFKLECSFIFESSYQIHFEFKGAKSLPENFYSEWITDLIAQ